MRGFAAVHNGLRVRLGAALALTCWLANAEAQDVTRDPTVRRGEMTFTYQYSEEQDLKTSAVTIPTPVFTTHTVDFNLRYALGERWTVEGGIPLIRRKVGGVTHGHDPALTIPPHPEERWVDDGKFHTFFQDLRLGARYLLLTDPVIVEPYIMLSRPASDYPFFAVSAVGQQLDRTEVGATFAYRPPFLNWFFGLELGYAFVEKTLDINVNSTRVDAQAVYFVNPRISVKGFFSSKNGKGIQPPTPDPTSQIWYLHDKLLRHNYISTGVGMDLTFTDRDVLNVSLIQMSHTEDIYDLRGALSVSLSRAF